MVFFSNLTKMYLFNNIQGFIILFLKKNHIKNDPLRKSHVDESVFVNGCVQKTNWMCKNVICLVYNSISISGEENRQIRDTHNRQIDHLVHVSLELVTTHRIRQQLNWQGTSACLGFRFPLLPASPRHAPSVFPLTGSHGPACKFGCFLCTLFAEALIHDFQRKWNLPVSIRWHGLTLYLLKPNLQLSSLFVLLGRDDNGEFVCSR